MFKNFKIGMQQQFQEMIKTNSVLFLTDVDKDLMWETYLDSFPEGTNNIYKERREHDCNCCRHFIRNYGNIVIIKECALVSIWDFVAENEYEVVRKAMQTLVTSAPIKNVFVSKQNRLGTDYNFQESEISSTPKKWEHFFLNLPSVYVSQSIDSEESIQAIARTSKEVFKRALDEISIDSVETVLELIAQKSIYRGAEFENILSIFLSIKKIYNKIKDVDKDNYCWSISTEVNSASYYVRNSALSHIRNSAIGTLLVNLSDGISLDAAVASFEKIMAPANYKRPTAILTKKMIEDAQKAIALLGFEESLGRRFAIVNDITINNVIFANRNAKKAMNVFDSMLETVAINPKKLGKIEEITINDFIANVVPTATSIEVLFENKHCKNLVSLIAPITPEAPSMFKWSNPFSWAYDGNNADSIKEKVKAAGGRVDGILRVSLSWNNYDDLDIHVKEPKGNHIYFSNKGFKHLSSAILDVDANAGTGKSRTPVENIIWTDESKIPKGVFEICVNNFNKRETIDFGFTVEIEYKGELFTFDYTKALPHKQTIEVARFEITSLNEIKFITTLPEAVASKEMWGIKSNQFHKVSMMMFSPNYWDEQSTGNKHHFFMLEGCINPTSPRGFFNEYLQEKLLDQKRVFEALGSQMKVESSKEQLSGLGFSSTQTDDLTVRVEGSFTRIIKIKF